MIKLIDYKDFEQREIYISKSSICRMKRKGNDGLTTANIIGYGECYFSETPEEILAIPDIETTEKVIDWEQRRYELIKDFISATINRKEDKLNYKEFVEIHDLADIIIENLKKGQGND